MKVFKFSEKNIGRAASTKPAVVIVPPSMSVSKADSLIERFPNSLRISEITRDMSPRPDYFNVLRIGADELATFDYDLKGCGAMLITGVGGLFSHELAVYREEIAEKAGLEVERIRICCSFLSEPGCDNMSCYSAGAIRDYAAEVGITGVFPTTKKEVLAGNSLCLCVKSDK